MNKQEKIDHIIDLFNRLDRAERMKLLNGVLNLLYLDNLDNVLEYVQMEYGLWLEDQKRGG